MEGGIEYRMENGMKKRIESRMKNGIQNKMENGEWKVESGVEEENRELGLEKKVIRPTWQPNIIRVFFLRP